MCGGITVERRDLPESLLAEHGLDQYITRRRDDATEEVQFLFWHPHPMLPVIWDGQLQVIDWGNRDKACSLPKTGWARHESIEAGKWRYLHPESVIIPARYGVEKGVWFAIREGIQGVVVRDKQRSPHVYMLTEAASHYYNVMTRHDRMPVLIGERI